MAWSAGERFDQFGPVPVSRCGKFAATRAFEKPEGLEILLVREDAHLSGLTIPGANFEFAPARSEEHTSELQSLMRISYSASCLQNKKSSDPRTILLLLNMFSLHSIDC